MAPRFERAQARPNPDKRQSLALGVDEYHASKSSVCDLDDPENGRASHSEKIFGDRVARAAELQEMENEIAMRDKYRDTLRFVTNPALIREIAKTPTERKICLEVYKEVVAERLRGIGAIRVYLLDTLAQNPNAELEPLQAAVTSLAEQHHMSTELVVKSFQEFFTQYRSRRNRMACISNTDIEKDAAELEICIEKVYRDTFSIFIVGTDITDSGEVKKSGGGSYWKRYRSGIYTHVRPRVSGDFNPKARIHEEQHALYNLEHPFEPDAFTSRGLSDSLYSARNEMLACLRESDGKLFDIPWLRPRYKRTGEPDAYEYMHTNLSENEKSKYQSYIKKGEIAANRLLQSGLFGVEEMVGILSQTPLERWPATATRILAAKNSKKEYTQLRGRANRLLGVVRKLWSSEEPPEKEVGSEGA